MSRESDVIGHAVMLLEQSVAWTTNGTADKPRRVRKVDLALEHIKDWMTRLLPRDGERGGSSSPREADDRVEAQRVGHQVRRDQEALAEHLKNLNVAARGIYDITVRNVETIDPAKLPLTPLPGCLSCARVEMKGSVRIGGHFASVMPAEREQDGTRGNRKANDAGLCRWCWEAKEATGKVPEVDECDTYHREGPRAAGLLRAKRERRSA